MIFNNENAKMWTKEESKKLHNFKLLGTCSLFVLVAFFVLGALGVFNPYIFFFVSALIFTLGDLIAYRKFGIHRDKLFGTKYNHPYLLTFMKINKLKADDMIGMSHDEIKSNCDKTMVLSTVVNVVVIFAITCGIHYLIHLI